MYKSLKPLAQLRRFASEPPIMAAVRADLKAAMRSGNTTVKNTLRDVMSTLKNANIERPDSISSDVSFHAMLQSLLATRARSAEEYAAAGRKELAENERAEMAILEELASKIAVATDEEIEERVRQVVKTLGLAEIAPKAALGKVMAEIKRLDPESAWNTSTKSAAAAAQRILGLRKFSTLRRYHENPLGIPRRKPSAAGPTGPHTGPRSIPGVEKIILVSSAKGGVGKSTVSVNLAQALFERGHATGILDADIFGPSIPRMLHISSEPKIKGGMLLPLANYGLKAMSMGFLVPSDKAVAWRGLLIQKALQQLLFEVDWGNLDYLIVDMPPGTGDVQLTIAQQLKVDGAVVVTTPQDIALIDAVRGIDMFRSTNTPILGLVQNMSLFVCPNCSHKTHIFGSDGAIKEANRLGVDVLASIPLSTDISNGGETGLPAVLIQGNSCSQFYLDLADKVAEKCPKS